VGTTENAVPCTWCGEPVEPSDGFRLGEFPGDRGAVFCRLEHVVPWAIQGPHWEAGLPVEPSGLDSEIDLCAQCGEPLADVRVILVRHRGEHRVPDGFCSVTHLREWAQAGGRYAG
jgi:hypothetical protein